MDFSVSAALSSWRGQFSAEVVLPPLSVAQLHLAFCPAEADELLSAVLIFSVHRHFSLGKAGLGCTYRAGRGAKTSPVAPPSLTEHKVIVGGGTHSVKYVGFVRDLEL